MADVFLSYAHADRHKARELAKTLIASGWTVFWDRAIPSGPRFRDVIARELESAKCVVVLWSQASVQSDWVIDEAEEARVSGRLVPAVLETVKIPHGFRGLQTANLANWKSGTADAEFDLLIGGIEAFAPRPTPGGTTSPRAELRADPTSPSIPTLSEFGLKPTSITETEEEPSASTTAEDDERGDSADDEPPLRLAHAGIPQPSAEPPAPRSLQPVVMEASITTPTQLGQPSDTVDVDVPATAASHGRDARFLAGAAVALLLAGITTVPIVTSPTVLDDLGFDPSGVMMMEVTLPESRYKAGPEVTRGFESLLERVRALPGVRAAAAVDVVPTRERESDYLFKVLNDEEVVSPVGVRVIGDYFAVLNLQLVSGVLLSDNYQPALHDVVVSQSLTKSILAKGYVSPIGTKVYVSPRNGSYAWVSIIGVVNDVSSVGGKGTSRRPHIYLPPDQYYFARRMTVLAKLGALSVRAALPGAVTAFDPQLPTPPVTSLEDVVRSSMSKPRFGALVISLLELSAAAFALLGLVLLGLYFRRHVPAR